MIYRRVTDQNSDYHGKTGAVVAVSDGTGAHPMVRLELPYGEMRWFLLANTAPVERQWPAFGQDWR